MHRLLLLIPLALSAVLARADEQNFWTRPDVHGDMVVFTCEGDLWLGSLKDHSAQRITNSPGTETNARFSPDGTKIAFTANYDGGADVYVMPVNGGAPKRLTYDPATALVQCWSPDGKYIIYRSRHNNPPGNENRLFEVPADGGQATMLPVPRGDFASLASDGQLAYVPVSAEWMNWFHYEGGAADDVWLADLNTHKFKQLTTSPTVDTTPVWSGKKIYYASQSAGTSNLFEIDPNSKETKEVTHFDLPVRYPGADGEHVVFQLGPGLGIYDTRTGESSRLTFNLNSDEIHERVQRIAMAPSVTRAAIGPSGKRILVEARGQVWSVAAKDGDARMLENQPGSRAMGAAWSPDGKTVAFLSDRSSEYQVWLVPATGGVAAKLTSMPKGEYSPLLWSPDGNWLATSDRSDAVDLINAKTGEFRQVDISPGYEAYDAFVPDYRFSPDSKLLAYDRLEDNWNLGVWVYDIAGKKKAMVSDVNINSWQPTFTPDGKYLAFLQDREIHPGGSGVTHDVAADNTTKVTMVTLSPDIASPFLPKNDEEGAAPEPAKPSDKPAETPKPAPVLDGIALRTIDVPMPASRYQKLLAADGKLLALDRVNSPLGPGDPTTKLVAFDIDKSSMTTLNDNVSDFDVSSDGKRLLVMHGNTPAVVDVSTQPFGPQDGVVSLSPYSLTIDPKQEWNQIFHESWRIARDFFYEPTMHGLDWQAVGQHYESLLPMVGDRTDLTQLLKDMVSELNIGHAYVIDPTPPVRRVPVGYLGADFAPVPDADAVRITHILRGNDFDLAARSPLLEPGVNVHEGDYIVSVGGQPVKRDQDIQALLIGTPGQVIALGINDQPTTTGQRIVRVKPLASEGALRYADWVEGRREYVRTHGGADLAYFHIPNMGQEGLDQFTEGYYPNVFKDGMIVDTRENTGGWISSQLLRNIAARPIFYFHPRYGNPWAREDWAPIGYKAAICNEGNFSDGELFIESWKAMHIGPVIGKRTGGGEVGSGGGYGLIDGGSIYVPNYGAYDANGHWIIEGKGATPDITVEEDPNAVLEGRDPQLDKAIEVLEAQIKKNPPHRPSAPPDPNKVWKAG